MYSRNVRRKGTSTDLMPSIMGEIEDRLGNTGSIIQNTDEKRLPKRSLNANSFANLSPNVQKILANVSDQELNKNFSSEETISPIHRKTTSKCSYSLKRSPEKVPHKPNENHDIISPNVQKMLSNLPDTELILPSCTSAHEGDDPHKNSSFLHVSQRIDCVRNSVRHFNKEANGKDAFDRGGFAKRSFLHKFSDSKRNKSAFSVSDTLNANSESDCANVQNNSNEIETSETFSQKPLGSFLHNSTSGIASRTPVGRKNIQGFLQVPSESSVGTNSTTSSEVSRPVSLTSLGSCSSSGSSGMHQPSSAYMASAESLDSDPEPTGSQGSADSGIAEQPNMSPDQRVLQEVVDSEAVYVSDLRQVIQGYLEPWRADEECLLQPHLNHLFSNIEQIYQFNKSFLEHLKEANLDPSRTADVFLDNNFGFSIYTEYCTHYPRTMSVLIDLMRDEKMAVLFKEKQTLLGHALPLGSYLLKPVQRILKYHVLLQRLSKDCDPSHKVKVEEALATMANVASDINTMKKKHEHDLRVQEIQSQLYGWTGPDLTTLGELIAEGTFRVRGARGRRHVFLFDKLLLMAKGKQDGGLTYKSHIMCSNLMLLEQVRGEPLCFHILPFDNPRLQSTLRAKSPQHKREWTLQLKRVILENYSAVIPSHARQLVMQLGQDIVADVENTNERWSPLRQYSTPQYLERRSRIRKTRDFGQLRSASQDRFPSLSRWRRKSEPFDIQQYNTKTVPRKISKIKKTKETRAKFYTDLSDSENYDVICESTDSLNVKDCDNKLGATYEDIQETCAEHESQVATTTLEQVVSDLLMQNNDYKKFLNRRKNIRDSEPGPGIWTKPETENLPPKSDSLPRSFQLNEQNPTIISESKDSIELKVPDTEIEEEDFDDSHIDKSEHPEHKIYRKSTIRFSLLQRFRAMITEEAKKYSKLPTHKQGSKSMGAKLANPDYADPQKLFAATPSASQTTLNESMHNHEDDVTELMGEPVVLDISFSANEVFTELDKKLNISKISNSPPPNDTGQFSQNRVSWFGKSITIPHIRSPEPNEHEIMHSSKSLDSYYEVIMEKNLSDGESVTEDFGSIIESHSANCVVQIEKDVKNIKTDTSIKAQISKPILRRPNKAPPPIPVKPARLSTYSSNNCNKNLHIGDPKGITKSLSDNSSFRSYNKDNSLINQSTINGNNVVSTNTLSEKVGTKKNSSSSFPAISNCNSEISMKENICQLQSKGWVKMIVDRFE